MSGTGGPLVALAGVSFSYRPAGGGGRPALHDVTLEVRPGESVVVLGANGAGKSSLAALLAGVVQPTTGEVVRAPVADADGRAILPAGLVTQNPEDSFTSPIVREEMGVILENLDRDPAVIDAAVGAMLAEIGLADHAQAHPAELSGGQKQLLALASVLIAEPPLLLLDEPLTLLDAAGRGEVESLLARSRGTGRATVFFSSEVEDAARGERVVVLHEGEIVWEGASADLPHAEARLAAWGLLPAGPAATPADIDPASLRGAEDDAAIAAAIALDRDAVRAMTDAVGEGDASGDGAGGCRRPSKGVVQRIPAVIIRDLHFTYDSGTPWARPVLRGVDLEARSGEVLGVTGPIGSGKTTLIRHLNGLQMPQRGTVQVGTRVLEPGLKLDRLLAAEIGIVFQFPEKQLFGETVFEDVAAGLEFAGVEEEAIAPRVRAALARVGLDPDAAGGRSPFALTWGEKRLAAIAGVLALETPCVALDEPGAGLDPAGRRRIGALLGDLARREGRTVIVVSHHLGDLRRMADRVVLLREGMIAGGSAHGGPRRPPRNSGRMGGR